MPQNTDRRRENYHKGRAELIEKRGGQCVHCKTKENLEFDHIFSDRTWDPRKTARWVRLARVKREASKGKIQLLCRACNAKKK